MNRRLLVGILLFVALPATWAHEDRELRWKCDRRDLPLEIGAADAWDPCQQSEPIFRDAPRRLESKLRHVTEDHWVVQFNRPLTQSERCDLRKGGLALTHYVNRLAYIERIEYAKIEKLYKEHDAFRAVVGMRDGFNVSRCGLSVIATRGEWHGESIDDVGPLVSDGDRTCDPSRCRRPSLPAGPAAGEPELVSVIDAGCVDSRHAWFEDRLHLAQECSHQPDEPFDEHATFTAGLLLAGGCDAPDRLPNLEIWSAPRSRKIYDVLDRASAAGARVHNLSWHEERRAKCEYGRLARAADRFVWEHEDAIVVASAPNQGYAAGPPGTAKNTVSVSSAECDGARCAMKRERLTGDGRIKADVTAPGCCLCSSRTCGDQANVSCDGVISSSCANPFAKRCANSWATPIVSREAARLRQFYSNPSGALLKATLLNVAEKMPEERSYPSRRGGWGFLRGDGDWPEFWYRDVEHAQGLRDPGEYEMHEIALDGPEEVRVTLVWTDPPPSFAGYRRPLVNDLDLIVVAPGDELYYRGNRFDDATWRSVPCSRGTDCPDAAGLFRRHDAFDATNNVEQVIVKPQTGMWKIYVFAREINVTQPTAGDCSAADVPGQGYAIVVSPATHASPDDNQGRGGDTEPTVEPEAERDGPTTRQPRSVARGARWPKRRWSELVGTLGTGRDSNPSLLPAGAFGKRTSMGQFDIDLGHRLTWFERNQRFREKPGEGKYLPFVDVDLGIGFRKLRHSQREDSRQTAYDVNAAVELRPCQGRRCLTMGARYRYLNLSLGDAPFGREDTIEFAGAFSGGRRQGECELNPLKLFVARQAFQDREPGVDSALNRSGTFTRVGVQKSFASSALDTISPDKYQCTGQNLFRDLYLHDFWSTHVGIEAGFEPTEGIEYERRWGRFNWAGRVPFGGGPICRSESPDGNLRCREWPGVRPVLDWRLSYEKSDHTDGFAFGRERSDSRYALDLGFVLPFRRLSEKVSRWYSDLALRVGGSYSRTESNIERFDHDRAAYFVNLDFAAGRRTYHGSTMETFKATPSPGSTINDTQTGPQRPEPRKDLDTDN